MDSALLARHKEAYNSGNNEDRSTTEQRPRERFPSLWMLGGDRRSKAGC